MGTAWAFYRLFKAADEVVADDKKKLFSDWITKARAMPFSRILPFFQLFNFVFSNKHFSLKCFTRSAVCSIAVTVVVGIVYYTINYPRIADFDLMVLFHLKDLWWFFLFFSIIPDFLLLLQTRLILKILAESQGFLKVVGLILLDVILTLGLLWAALAIAMTLLPIRVEEAFDMSFFKGWYVVSADYFPNGKVPFPYILFTLSALFTSIWLWLFVLSTGLMRCYTNVWRLLSLPKHFLRLFWEFSG